MPVRRTRRAFTLVELLVVISVIGILMSLLLPAVQYSRETARQVTCKNNLKQQVLALHNFHDAHRQFPPGCLAIDDLDHSWCTYILPYLEQEPLYSSINLRERWNDPNGNYEASRAILSVFRCPSSIYDAPGDTDYGGIRGSALTGAGFSRSLRNGVLVAFTESDRSVISFASVIDGTSNTICIAESADSDEASHGSWADGMNIFAHDNGGINLAKGEIYSLHRTGAYAARVDGGILFLPKSIDKHVVGALCTRDGGETFDFHGL